MERALSSLSQAPMEGAEARRSLLGARAQERPPPQQPGCSLELEPQLWTLTIPGCRALTLASSLGKEGDTLPVKVNGCRNFTVCGPIQEGQQHGSPWDKAGCCGTANHTTISKIITTRV